MRKNYDIDHIGIYDRGGTWDYVANIIFVIGYGSFPISSAADKKTIVALIRNNSEYDRFRIIYHGFRGDEVLSEAIVEE